MRIKKEIHIDCFALSTIALETEASGNSDMVHCLVKDQFQAEGRQ